MTSKIRLLLLAALLAAVGITATTPATAVSYPEGDFIRVTKVMVDKLGGVNVSGVVSCQGAYDRLVAGELQAQDEYGNPSAIPAPNSSELVVLAANSDNYTVSQPAGRKTMITLTHGSSRMGVCFRQTQLEPWGESPVQCTDNGSVCPWETDHYAWDHAVQGPLFEYSADGKFAAKTLNVTAHSVGLLIMILDQQSATWRMHWVEEGSYSVTSATIKAVAYR